MADWNPGDLCQVRRGKRWVDAEIHSLAGNGAVRVAMYGPASRADYSLHWADPDDLRHRPAPRGKLPEPYRIDGLPQRVFEADTEEKRDADARSEGKVPHLSGKDRFRSWSQTQLRPVPKPTTARSLAYLAHVRRHPCCSCGATEAIHAHHVASGGMGAKASDYLTAPLCGPCHQHWHATATLPGISDTGALLVAQSRSVLWQAAARCLEEWITREGER